MMVHVTPPPSLLATPAPAVVSLATGDAAGVQNGGSGAGAGAGINGEGGANGTGSGSGGEGNGNGAPAPCGVVWLDPISLSQNHDGSRTVGIRLEVTMTDGSTVSDVLGWRFHYRREADDPFSAIGRRADLPPLLQLPPAGYDLEARQKAATVYAVQHTNAQGFTDLEDCPQKFVPQQ